MPACDTCYRRKVRCVSEANRPCLACMRSKVECTFLLAERHAARRRQKRRPQEQLNDDGSADRTALAQFQQQSIRTSSWRVFGDGPNMRIAYIGTPASNLAQLVADEARFDGPHAASLHFPFPSIRPLLPWKPDGDVRMLRSVDEIGSLPSPDLRQSLIDAFFEKVHPGFPIINEREFRSSDHPPPLLLLQAVLLVGAQVCEHAKISQSRGLVKAAIFRRAKALFDLRYENDRMHLVQAALLFTWQSEGADDVSSNAYYWVGVACRIAFGLGMHRNLAVAAKSRMPADERRIYRRIWWTLVQLDVLASLHTGRPLMIAAEDCDQPPLQENDFIEGTELSRGVDAEFCIQHSVLCDITAQILRLASPGAAREFASDPSLFETRKSTLDMQLNRWFLQLPARLADTHRRERTTFLPLQLQMHYHMALLHLHRLKQPVPSPSSSSSSIHTRVVSDEICRSAAVSIASTFDSLIATNQLSQCWFTCLTSLLAAAIQLSSEARSALQTNNSTLEIQAQARLERLLTTASVAGRFWPGADGIYSLYSDLLQQLKRDTKVNLAVSLESQTPSVPTEPTPMAGEEELAMLFGAGQTYEIGDIAWPELEDYLQI
ncbi:hypothetical protein ASPZODRAFT_17494 [Penicilliopsis zonata CBS 506.65]|uniref:Zn(2)-C6 fungal-type domain-containing protein n=1 Tax=Penicilliopsis zonata CBS 506.65 TaxID=1073090 RepID=A0A1L9SDH4_9EURO|nr:hypothetical protein ASPZODRAFT_17494 [Penicilliopsis zonata CBS 506.65]OJJ45275.1 hypothetical protein ASPZODRAFT_17494 [Penicilliopsis zonata CBS 506.65]